MSKSKIKNQNYGKSVRVFLTGGGTGGSVSPLLAVKEELDKKGHNLEYFWIGGKEGVEKEMVEALNKEEKQVQYKSIPSGKWRRYFSLRNFFDLFKIFAGFFKSLFLILRYRPKLVLSAGSFVSVPVVWAAWLFRRPVLIHQQDVRPGLANRLMAPFARVVTTAFEKSKKDYGKKAKCVGNPIRMSLNSDKKESYFQIKKEFPLVLVVGGGTGAQFLNELVETNLEELTKFAQIIHVTGKGKASREIREHYSAFEFLSHDLMLEALEKADLVISRSGLGFLTELSYFSKPAILIPMPDSHQEDNAQVFQEKKAALVLKQKEISSKNFISSVRKILEDKELKTKLSERVKKVIKIGNAEIAEIIEKELGL